MATAAPARPAKRAIWQSKGSWSSRDDRVPSAVWLGILWFGWITGFGFDFSRFRHETPPAPGVLYLHAIVFSLWALLVTAQVLLVLGDRVAWHRRLGWLMVGWAGLMTVLGPWAAMASQVAVLHTPNSDPAFLALNLADIGGFVLLFGWALALRKNPAAHKRMMMLSLVALADPGFSRLATHYLPDQPTSALPWFLYFFYGNVLLIGLMAAWDWWRGRLIASFGIAAAALLASEWAAAVLYFWGPWKPVALAWLTAWAKAFG